MYPWKVGELAVCVREYKKRRLTGNCIYMIRGVYDTDEGLGVLINGPDPIEAMFWDASRFRPLNKADLDRLAEKYRQPIHVDQLIEKIKEGMK